LCHGGWFLFVIGDNLEMWHEPFREYTGTFEDAIGIVAFKLWKFNPNLE
jgi:hypothetical protein